MKAKVVISRIVFVLYILAVAWLCLYNFQKLPSVQRSYWGIPTDKIVHFLMFFPFPILAFISYDKRTNTTWQSILYAVSVLTLGTILAVLTEYAQSFLPYRTADQKDFMADFLALSICTVLVFITDLHHNSRDRKKKRTKKK